MLRLHNIHFPEHSIDSNHDIFDLCIIHRDGYKRLVVEVKEDTFNINLPLMFIISKIGMGSNVKTSFFYKGYEPKSFMINSTYDEALEAISKYVSKYCSFKKHILPEEILSNSGRLLLHTSYDRLIITDSLQYTAISIRHSIHAKKGVLKPSFGGITSPTHLLSFKRTPFEDYDPCSEEIVNFMNCMRDENKVLFKLDLKFGKDLFRERCFLVDDGYGYCQFEKGSAEEKTLGLMDDNFVKWKV
jgi:hypothetical protein